VLISLLDRDQATGHPPFRLKLEAVGFGVFIPVFFVTSGLSFDLSALFASSSTMAPVPLFLLAILLARSLPALPMYVGLQNAARPRQREADSPARWRNAGSPPGCRCSGRRPRGWRGVLGQDADAGAVGHELPGADLVQGFLDDAAQHLPGEPGPHSVSNPALQRIDVDLDARLVRVSRQLTAARRPVRDLRTSWRRAPRRQRG
jgi:hypothetical protein